MSEEQSTTAVNDVVVEERDRKYYVFAGDKAQYDAALEYAQVEKRGVKVKRVAAWRDLEGAQPGDVLVLVGSYGALKAAKPVVDIANELGLEVVEI